MGGIPFTERRWCSVAEACQFSGLGRTRLFAELAARRVESKLEGRRRLVSVPSLVARCEPVEKPEQVGSVRSIDGREFDTSSGFISRHRNPNRFTRRAEHRLLDHAIDRLPGADSLEREFAQELRPHAACAHKFRREQGRALEILAHRLDARG
jgi:hypothetical protein